jgi:transcriptional regulator with XRE-family HTH domain
VNLVQSEMRARLRHGLTQTELARELGIALPTLSNVLNGNREAGLKTLKALGIIRHIVYTLTDDHSIPESIQARAPLPRAKRGKRPPPVRPLTVTNEARIALIMRKLTTARIKLAVSFKVNPREAWLECWKGAMNAGDMDDRTLDDHWCDYLASRGTQSAPKAIESPFAAGELYAHLKPVNRGIDHRRPLAMGEHPPIRVNNDPEAS